MQHCQDYYVADVGALGRDDPLHAKDGATRSQSRDCGIHRVAVGAIPLKGSTLTSSAPLRKVINNVLALGPRNTHLSEMIKIISDITDSALR